MAEIVRLQLDAAVLYDPVQKFHETLRSANILCVEASARNLDLDDAATFIDDQAVCRMALEYFRNIGLDTIGYCGVARSAVSLERLRYLKEITAESEICVHAWQDEIAEGLVDIEKLINWLKTLPKPIGLLAYDDKLAERILSACRWAEIRVPNDIALLGIGDDELLTDLTSPRLSSIALPLRKVGQCCALQLDALLRGKSVKERFKKIQPTEVVVRASTDRFTSEDPVVLAAISYLRVNPMHSIGIEQIAEAIGTTRRTLERRFSNATGQTVHDYLIDLRLRHAKRLLRQSSASLRELAPLCGYASLSAFIRMFRQITGQHPNEWRRHR
jgi:LacI family transcriptional regulator